MKARTRLHIYILSTLICVALFLGATYTWFSANRSSEGSNAQIQIDGDSMSVTSYQVMRYSLDDLRVEDITFSPPYSLIPFDSIFKERNKNTPLLLRVEIEGFAATSESVSFTVGCDPEHDEPKKRIGNTDRWTSDIVYIDYITERQLAAAGVSVNTSDVTEMFDAVTGYLLEHKPHPERFAFASKSGSRYEYTGKRTEIECNVELLSGDITNRNAVIYIIFDYDPNLIEANNISVSLFDVSITDRDESVIAFDNDIRRITFTGLTVD